jgi:hypothetical protein
MSDPAGLRPLYLPSGFAFARQVIGPAAYGFGRTADQALSVFVRGNSIADATNPVALYVASSDGAVPALTGTEGRAGVNIGIAGTGMSGVYHDGMWAIGSGSDEHPVADGSATVYWNREAVHSITVQTDTWTVGVRAPRALVDIGELVQVVASVPLA